MFSAEREGGMGGGIMEERGGFGDECVARRWREERREERLKGE